MINSGRRRGEEQSEPLFFDVGDRLRLIPFRFRGLSRSDRVELIVDPGPAFGIGDHPTTIMALDLLESVTTALAEPKEHRTLLDVGTGTGVVAMAAISLGVGFTVALDTDPVAVACAKRNLVLNGIPADRKRGCIELVTGGVESVGRAFDVVVANLVAPVLIRIREDLEARVGEYLILSGIADPMWPTVLDAYDRGRLKLVTSRHVGGWSAALFTSLSGKEERRFSSSSVS